MDITSRKAGNVLIYLTFITLFLDFILVEIFIPAPDVVAESIQLLIQMLIMKR